MTISTEYVPTRFRTLIAGLAGGLAWIGAMLLLFGPAQAVLADPAHQSAKFLAVFGSVEPLPRMVQTPWVLFIGLLVMGMLHATAYSLVRRAFVGMSWWGAGLRFGSVAWLLMVPWFEFYLPWNVMHEPAALVALEMVLWAGVMLLVGLTLAAVHELRAAN